MSNLKIERYKEMFKGEDTTNFDAFDFLHAFASSLVALLYSELFWPNFVEINDMVFLEFEFENKSDLKRLDDAKKAYNYDKIVIEKAFNTIEVPYLFGAHLGDTSDDEDLILANILAKTWKARLADQFPNKRFSVYAEEPGPDDDCAVVIFHQVDEGQKG